jgi:ABC-type phosphate transport system substrate-binding protein
MANQRSVSRLTRALSLLLGIVLVLAPAIRRAVAEGAYVVIVNAGNPVSSLSVSEVSELFLKKACNWPDGTKAAPVDFVEGSPVHESFSKGVLGKNPSAVKAYWQKMIFAGREVPPPEKATPEDVVGYVRANPGGIGYVPAGTALGAGVKILKLRP